MTESGQNNFFIIFPHILDQIEMFYFTILSEFNVTNTFSLEKKFNFHYAESWPCRVKKKIHLKRFVFLILGMSFSPSRTESSYRVQERNIII